MSTDFLTIVKEFTNAQLLHEFYTNKDQYTPESIGVMEKEIGLRRISDEEKNTFLGAPEENEKEYLKDDFVAFDYRFSNTDIVLAGAICKDCGIVCYVNKAATDVLNVEPTADVVYTLYVHKEFIDKAHEALDEHFEKDGGLYRLRELPVADKLRLINFNEISLSAEIEQHECEVSFSLEEQGIIARYVRKLIDEVDTVEQSTGRPVFFYDNLEDIEKKLSKKPLQKLCVGDILAIMEVIQVYCTKPDFPSEMNETITGLLGFLSMIAKG